MQVPPQAFKFSSSMKHQTIKLSENNTRARGTGYGYPPLVVVEPSVSGNTPCRAVFKINSIGGGYVYVGVCLPSVVAANGYEVKRNFTDYAAFDNNYQHGTFIIGNKYGYCFTHGNQYTKTGCSFAAGQSVAVEWQPATRQVWWSVVGTDKRHGVSIPSELLQRGPLHFVAELCKGADVSVAS